MPAIIYIQHSTGGLNQCKKVRKTNEGYSSGKGRVQFLSTDNALTYVNSSYGNPTQTIG